MLAFQWLYQQIALSLSLVFFAFNEKCEIYGHGFWKFNSSAIYDNVLGIKKLIPRFKSKHKANNLQLNWELLKDEIQKLTTQYSPPLKKKFKGKKT